MEIRKRWSSAESALPDKNATEEASVGEAKDTEELHIIPGIPPRSRIHAKGPKKAYGYLFSFLALSVVAGGAWWWMDRPDLPGSVPSQGQASQMPEVRKADKGVPADAQAIAVKPPEQPKPSPLPSPVTDKQAVPKSNLAAEDKPASSPQPQPPVFKKILKHKVEQEETLYRISRQYYHTGKYASFLARYNGLAHPSDLKFGTYIRVPFPPVK